MPAIKKISFIFLLAAFLALFWPKTVHSQVTEELEGEVAVTAFVKDQTPPTPPVLISPTNNAFINSHYHTFCFYKATDSSSQIMYYQLFLNGEVVIPQIPASISPYEGSNFSLTATADSICVSYKTYMDDGSYSWKIRVYDENTNYADSATWILNVDTVPPSIYINRIDDNKNLNLNTDDPNSIPDNLTFQTPYTYPEFCGKTESSITVLITLTGANDNKVYILPKTTSEGNGNFCIKADQSLPFKLYKVSITASDRAGNTAIMKTFYLLITAPAIGPYPIIITPEIIIEQPKKIIEIIKEPEKIPQEVEKIIAKPEALLQMPASPELGREISFFPLLLLILLIAYLILISKAFQLLPCSLPLFFWLLLWPFRRDVACNVSTVYCSLNKKHLSFTTIKIFKNIQSGSEMVFEEVNKLLADLHGRFDLKLDQGTWKLKPTRPGYLFPSNLITSDYHGENISVQSGDRRIYTVNCPMDPGNQYRKYQKIILCIKLIGTLLAISSLLTFAFIPTWLNLFFALFFCLVAIKSRQIN